MSDPRDELLDRIQVELHRIPAAIERAFSISDSGLVERLAKSHEPAEVAALSRQIDLELSRRCALALGQCQAIAEQLLKALEYRKLEQSKTGADDSAAPG